MQGVADAENLAIETTVHLPLYEAMQGKIHGDAGGKQRNNDKHQRDRKQSPAQGSRDKPHEVSAVRR
jgi:hypothetical protein